MPPCFQLEALQVGHLYVGPGLVSMSPQSVRSRGRKASQPLLPSNEKTALGVLCGVTCWWVGSGRPTRPGWQSRHPQRRGDFSPDAAETGQGEVDSRLYQTSSPSSQTSRRRLSRRLTRPTKPPREYREPCDDDDDMAQQLYHILPFCCYFCSDYSCKILERLGIICTVEFGSKCSNSTKVIIK